MSSIIQIITGLFKDLKTKDTKDAFIDFFINTKKYFQLNEIFTNLFFIILLVFMIIIGYIIFFLNPYNILNYVRYPVIILYMLITGFILFFILLKSKESVKSYNLRLDIFLYSINFGKIILFIVGIFLAFYIVYGLFISLMTKSLNFSFLFTLIVVLLLLAIINSYTNMYDTNFGDNEYLNFIKDLVFFIPCLITDCVDFIIKDYNETPSTVIILLIILIIICIIYFAYNNISVPNNTIILIDKPVYLNTNALNLTQDELIEKIIEKKPFYERQLIKIQEKRKFKSSINDISHNDISDNLIDVINQIPSYADSYTRKYYKMYNNIEGFQNIITQETVPVHLTLNDYDQYILKQLLWKNPDILKNNVDNKDLGKMINDLISKHSTIIGYYEWILLKLQLLNSSNISKYILGDMKIASYHYGLSYWIYLNKQGAVSNKQIKPKLNKKDLIVKYGNRPSMYYDHTTKELIVQYIRKQDNENNAPTILYKTTDILFQRWNNIVMNYDYGIFDLFINGNLVYSNPKIVDFITQYEVLEAGNANNSNIGGISYVYYYEEPIDLEKIKNIYINHPSF